MHALTGVIKVGLQSGHPVYVGYNANDSILTIKNKLKQHTGIPLEKQILSHSSYLIQDNILIEDIAECYGKVINMNLDIPVLGGASNMNPFDAPDMTSSECFVLRSFSEPGTAPSYRVIGKGINFKAYCRNSGCIAQNDYVIIQLGMCTSDNGSCNYAEMMFELPCPACNQCVQPGDIFDVYFFNCTIGIKFRVANATCTKQHEMDAPSDKYLVLKDPKKILSYHFLKFTVK